MALSETETRLVLALHRGGPGPKYSFEGKAQVSRGTIDGIVDSLKLKGLIYEKQTKSFPFKHEIGLTIWGEKIAPLLLQVEEYQNQASKHARVS